jgi:hypothetical protein
MESAISYSRFFRLSRPGWRSALIYGIEVAGDAEFLLRTGEALALLQSFAQFEVIQGHLRMIRQARRSGVKAWAKMPTFFVGAPTWQHSALWYAGAIAHDAWHAKLYLDAKDKYRGKEPHADDWSGAEAEKKCLTFQRQVLLALNADATIIGYLDNCAQNPTYQGHNKGWRSWLDYRRRWW